MTGRRPSRVIRYPARLVERPVPLGLFGDLLDRYGIRRPSPRREGDFPLGLALDYLTELAHRMKKDGDA